MVLEEISFVEFQDGRGSHLWYWNGTILAILNLSVTVMFPLKFWLNPTYGLGGDVVLSISRWPPWISERNHLAILNLHVAPMAPIKFLLNLTYGFGGDIVWRISRWPPWRTSWISLGQGLGGDVVWRISRWPLWWPFRILERNDFSYFESLCHCDASH